MRDEVALWIWILIVAGLAAAIILSAGCSTDLFRVRREALPALPAKPEPSYNQKEAVRQLAEASLRGWARVHSEGAPSAAPLVGQMTRGAGVVSAEVGPPAKLLPLPEPGNYEAQPEINQAVQIATAERERVARKTEAYERKLDAYAAKTVEREWRIGIPLLGTILGLAATAAGLVVALRGLLKWRGAFAQVFQGVRKFLTVENVKPAIDPAQSLLDSLSGKMDQATKDLVAQLYKKLGESGPPQAQG